MMMITTMMINVSFIFHVYDSDDDIFILSVSDDNDNDDYGDNDDNDIFILPFYIFILPIDDLLIHHVLQPSVMVQYYDLLTYLYFLIM